MKKKLTLFLCLIACQMTFAGQVTETQARQKAQKFLKEKLLGEGSHARLKTAVQTANHQLFYVFNAVDDGGYVIVSGDDRTKEILAFSEHGNLDLANIPEHMKWWLGYYERSIASLGQKTYATRAVRREARKDVDVLINTTWHQESPFNDDCPEIGTGRCLTGCMATAMAQVMNYWQWPKAVDEIPAYDPWKDLLFGPSMKALPATSFNWEVITTNNRKDSEFKKEVAKLCRYCGQSVRMGYATNNEGGSKVLDGMGPVGLVNHFGYDKGVHNVYRGAFSDEDWENIIYNELANGRPVIYSGQTEAIYSGKPYGHTFICDGYKEIEGVGFFSINWGWGNADTWCVLSLLDSGRIAPFTEDQSAIIGIQPPTAENEVNYKQLSITNLNLLTSPILTRESLTESFPSAYFNWVVKNTVLESTTAEVHFVLVRDNIMADYVPNSFEIKPGWHISSSENQISLGPNTRDGVYRFYPSYKMQGETTGLKPVEGSDYRYIEIKVSGLKMIMTVYPIEHLQGDANDDGVVSETDKYTIMDTIAAGIYDKNCDVNTDGKVTVADIVALLDILENNEQ